MWENNYLPKSQDFVASFGLTKPDNLKEKGEGNGKTKI